MGGWCSSLARWNLWSDSLEKLGQGTGAQRFAAVQALRAERRLPRFVGVEEGDQVLTIDLDNSLSVDTLIHLLKDRPRATLVELLPRPPAVVCARARGPLHARAGGALRAHPPRAARPRARPVPAIHRAGVPQRAASCPARSGSTPSSTRARPPRTGCSRDTVAPLVRSALGAGAADSWFFIRYGDPDWHLRLRFHGSPERLHLARELTSAFEGAHRERLLWKVQMDTYEREVERYGGPEGMLLAERLFQVDSEAVLQLLELLPGDDGADARWRLMLYGMDQLMGDLGLGVEEKRGLVTALRSGFGREFQAGRTLEHQLGERFRQERKGIEDLLAGRRTRHTVLAMGQVVLQRRSERLAPITAELRALAQEGRLSVPLSELAGSLLHMHANRLSRASARAQELVLYDLLARHYASQSARQRKAGANKE